MIIKKEQPPFFDKILAAGMRPTGSTVYTYGDTIYSPLGGEIPGNLVIHEQVHSAQQGENPDAWWDRYLSDSYFRMDQEVEAYREQYLYLQKNIKDRERLHKILFELAGSLSSPIYGNMITREAAMNMIKNNIK